MYPKVQPLQRTCHDEMVPTWSPGHRRGNRVLDSIWLSVRINTKFGLLTLIFGGYASLFHGPDHEDGGLQKVQEKTATPSIAVFSAWTEPQCKPCVNPSQKRARTVPFWAGELAGA